MSINVQAIKKCSLRVRNICLLGGLQQGDCMYVYYSFFSPKSVSSMETPLELGEGLVGVK